MKFIIGLDFKSKLSHPELSAFAINVLTRMRGNPKFESFKEVIETDLQAASDAFSVALQAAADGGRTKVAEKRAAAEALIDVLETVTARLNIVARGDEAMILDAGFRLRYNTQRKDAVSDQVSGLSVSAGAPGQVNVRFTPVPSARVYGIEWRTEEETSWHNGFYPTVTRTQLSDLPSRKDVLVRVFVIGTEGRPGTPCQPVKVFVL